MLIACALQALGGILFGATIATCSLVLGFITKGGPR